MTKKNVVIIVVIIAVLAVGTVGYMYLNNQNDEQSGREKFDTAIAELIKKDPGINNPCFGYSVVRGGSYAYLKDKSIEEIKVLIMKDPGSC